MKPSNKRSKKAVIVSEEFIFEVCKSVRKAERNQLLNELYVLVEQALKSGSESGKKMFATSALAVSILTLFKRHKYQFPDEVKKPKC